MSRRDGIGNEHRKVINEINNKTVNISSITKTLVTEACSELDDEMTYIRQTLINKTLDDELLSSYILELANILYFVGERMEDVGIKEDMCKSIRTELFNKLRDSVTGTKADKDSVAESGVQTETQVLSIYNHAYKAIKLKYDAGYEMLNSLKKVMNKRISELELSNSKYIGGSNDTRD